MIPETIIVNTGIQVKGITISSEQALICWFTAYSLECSKLDGSKRSIVNPAITTTRHPNSINGTKWNSSDQENGIVTIAFSPVDKSGIIPNLNGPEKRVYLYFLKRIGLWREDAFCYLNRMICEDKEFISCENNEELLSVLKDFGYVKFM